MSAGSLAHFGTYSVDAAGTTLTFHVERSSFPNWDGTTQKRTITAINPGDVVTWNVPAPAEGVDHAEIAWKWVK